MSYLAWIFGYKTISEEQELEVASEEQKRARNEVLKEIRELRIEKEKKYRVYPLLSSIKILPLDRN